MRYQIKNIIKKNEIPYYETFWKTWFNNFIDINMVNNNDNSMGICLDSSYINHQYVKSRIIFTNSQFDKTLKNIIIFIKKMGGKSTNPIKYNWVNIIYYMKNIIVFIEPKKWVIIEAPKINRNKLIDKIMNNIYLDKYFNTTYKELNFNGSIFGLSYSTFLRIFPNFKLSKNFSNLYKIKFCYGLLKKFAKFVDTTIENINYVKYDNFLKISAEFYKKDLNRFGLFICNKL